MLVVTHPDADHINYLAPTNTASSAFAGRRIGHALLSLDEAAYRETGTGARLMDWLAGSADEVRFLATGDASAEGQPSGLFDCGEDTAIYILAASEPSQSSDRALQRNTPSIVLLLEREITGGQRFRAILAGDATRETEAAILARYSTQFLDVDLLRVGHHGAMTSTIDPSNPSWRWLAITSPRYAITTAGHHGSHRHPRCAVMSTIARAGTLETDDDCHAIECGETANGACDGAADGPWCTYATRSALFNSANNGDVACSFDGEVRTSIQRGSLPEDDCAE